MPQISPHTTGPRPSPQENAIRIPPSSPSHPPLPFRFGRKATNSLESRHRLPPSAPSGHPAPGDGPSTSASAASPGKGTVRRSLDETVEEILRKIEEGTRRVVTLHREIRALLGTESKLVRGNEAAVGHCVSLLGRLADIAYAYRQIQGYVRNERHREAGEAREKWTTILNGINLGVSRIDQAGTFGPVYGQPLFKEPETPVPRARYSLPTRERPRIKEPGSPRPKDAESEPLGPEQLYSDCPPITLLLYSLVRQLKDL